MPAPVLVIHQEASFREMVLVSLQTAGYPAVGFDDPLRALDAIEADSRVRVLVTQVDFGEGQLNGAALVRMLRHNAQRDIQTVFVGQPSDKPNVSALGEFVQHSIDPHAVVTAVGRLLANF